MSAVSLMPVEEYLRLNDKPYCEYRDGEIRQKAMPTKLHSLVQFILLTLLKAQGVQPYPELTLRMGDRKYLVPDVAVAGDFQGKFPTEPVELCCEILSPDDSIAAAFSKCEEYHAWGVPYCWVIDPQKRTAWEYHSTGAGPDRVADALKAGQIAVSLPEIFSQLPVE